MSSSYLKMHLAKLNAKGKIKWIHNIDFNKVSKLMTDEHDYVYFSGYGKGATFPSINSNPQVFETKGSSDFYLAKYNNKGELLWLNAGGGVDRDYCSSFTLHDSDLIVLGRFSKSVTFNKTTTTAITFYSFWIAKFDQLKFNE